MFRSWRYLGTICFHVIFCFKITETFVYDINRPVEITKYDRVTGETFAASGNVIVWLSEELMELGRIEIGDKFVKDPKCAHISFEEDECLPLPNVVTVMEFIYSDPYTILFICLKYGEAKCFTVDIGRNISRLLMTVNDTTKFFDKFSGSSPASSSALETFNSSTDNQTKYLLFSHDIYLKHLAFSRGDKPSYFSLFSLIKVTDILNTSPKVQMLSDLKLHVDHNFTIIDNFEKNSAYYFVVRYWYHKYNVSDSVIQIRVVNNSVQLLEVRIKCADNFYVNQSSLFVDAENQTIYFLNNRIGNSNVRVICEIDVPFLETYFDNVFVDCTDKNKGSYPNWLNLSNSERSRGPCEKVRNIC